MANTRNIALQARLERLIAITELEVEQWSLARNERPFPDFNSSSSVDKAWSAGISEGQEIGRLKALKEILSKVVN